MNLFAETGKDLLCPVGTYARLSNSFINDLKMRFTGKRILEIFGGNGNFAAELDNAGFDVKSTSLFDIKDGSGINLCYDVEELDCIDAVRRYRDECDVLLISWPPAGCEAYRAILEWGRGKPILFVGEWTDKDDGVFGLGCCADQAFFDSLVVSNEISSYQTGNCLEKACICEVANASLADFCTFY